MQQSSTMIYFPERNMYKSWVGNIVYCVKFITKKGGCSFYIAGTQRNTNNKLIQCSHSAGCQTLQQHDLIVQMSSSHKFSPWLLNLYCLCPEGIKVGQGLAWDVHPSHTHTHTLLSLSGVQDPDNSLTLCLEQFFPGELTHLDLQPKRTLTLRNLGSGIFNQAVQI